MIPDNFKNSKESTAVTTQKNYLDINITKVIENRNEEDKSIKGHKSIKTQENSIKQKINDDNKENNLNENSLVKTIDYEFALNRLFENNFDIKSFSNDANIINKEKENKVEIKIARELLLDDIHNEFDEKSENIYNNFVLDNISKLNEEILPKEDKKKNIEDVKNAPPGNIIIDNAHKFECKTQRPLLNKKRNLTKNRRYSKKKKRSTHDYLIKKFLSNFLNKYIFNKLKKFGIHKCNYKINVKPNERGLLLLLKKTVEEVFTDYDTKEIEGNGNQKKNKVLIEEKNNFSSSTNEEELKKILKSFIEE